jgi:hypothetical protein
MEEELEPVSRIDLQAIPNRFGDSHLSFTAEHSFHGAGISSLYILAKVKRTDVDQQRDSALLEALFDLCEAVEAGCQESPIAALPSVMRGRGRPPVVGSIGLHSAIHQLTG